MKQGKKLTDKLLILFTAFCLFCLFFNGYKSAGPSRHKFKKLPGGHEDLIKPEPEPEINYLDEIKGDARLKKWMATWQRCDANLNCQTMEGLGQAFILDEELEKKEYDYLNEGPNSKFWIGSPGGKYRLNPYWGRLYYKKTDSGWQPYYDEGCGALVYESSSKKAVLAVRCSLLEGIEDAFWIDKDRFVLMGYETITRQMNVECESVQSCVAPTVWIVNMKNKTMQQYHGEAIQRKNCDVHTYVKTKYPELF